MTQRPTKLVVDCSTGITSEVELTDEEIAQREIDAIADAEKRAQLEAELQAAATAKQSAQNKLKALGLTDTEILAITGI